jgi:hypothetical protein
MPSIVRALSIAALIPPTFTMTVTSVLVAIQN